MTVGVYFSANDKVLPWVKAFLNSFRASNPNLRLYLIPFNDQCEQIIGLQKRFEFQIFEDQSFAALEELGQRYELGFTPHGKYWFRRYAAFWGPLNQFAYFDARQLILGDISHVFSAMDRLELDLIHFDTAINQVYEPGLHRESLVSDRRGAGFNSGRWFARRGVFSLPDFLKLGEDSLHIRSQLNPRNTDQAFINYCCDHMPIRTAHIADIFADICRNGWARQPGSIYLDSEGAYRLWDHGGLDHKQRVLLLHWAGIPLGPTMPQRRLFRQFQCQDENILRRAYSLICDKLNWSLQRIPQIVRQNRSANRLYRCLKRTRRRN